LSFGRTGRKQIKKGNSLCNRKIVDPSTPKAAKVQKAMNHLERDILGPYEMPGNRISKGMYDALPLLWQVDPAVPEFPESGFTRREWDRDGVLTDPVDFFGGSRVEDLAALERGLGTASTVTRWRAAHPDIANTDEDCVIKTMRRIRESVGPAANDKIRGRGSTVILFFKRK
jgi:hypothetical protein